MAAAGRMRRLLLGGSGSAKCQSDGQIEVCDPQPPQRIILAVDLVETITQYRQDFRWTVEMFASGDPAVWHVKMLTEYALGRNLLRDLIGESGVAGDQQGEQSARLKYAPQLGD